MPEQNIAEEGGLLLHEQHGVDLLLSTSEQDFSVLYCEMSTAWLTGQLSSAREVLKLLYLSFICIYLR